METIKLDSDKGVGAGSDVKNHMKQKLTDVQQFFDNWLDTCMETAVNEGYWRERAEKAEDKYNELLMEVESKFPGESRHDTAKRFIRESQSRGGDQGAKASA